MTTIEAARRLVGLEGWPGLQAPMLAATGWRVTGDEDDEHDPGARMRVPPDLEDHATRGIVLGMLSRRVGAYCWIRPTGLVMSVYRECPHCQAERIAVGVSWAAALVAAWEATPPPA